MTLPTFTSLALGLCLSLPIATAEDTPAAGDQSSRLWAMRKKVQQRAGQRTGTYLEQMNSALSDGDMDGAEAALKAAIAQGKMTQEEIDAANGRIAAKQHAQQAAMAANARAKADAQSRESASSASGAAENRPAAAGPGKVTVKFDHDGDLYVTSVELFNAKSGSPGTITSNKVTRKETDGALNILQFISADRAGNIAGTYGFKATWASHTASSRVFGGKGSEVERREQIEGTFEIPAGTRDVVITYHYYSPNKFRVYSSK